MLLVKSTYPRFGSKTLVYSKGLGYWRESLRERYEFSAPFVAKLIEHRAVLQDLQTKNVLSALTSVLNVFGPFRNGDPTFAPVNRVPTWTLKNLYSFIFNSLTSNTYSGTKLSIPPLYPNGNVEDSNDGWRAMIASILLARTFVASKYVQLADGPSDNCIYVLNNKKLIPSFFSESPSEMSLLGIVAVPLVREAFDGYFKNLQSASVEKGSIVLNDAASKISTEFSRMYLQISRTITEIQMSMASTYRVVSTITQQSQEALLPHHTTVLTKWYEYFNTTYNLTSFVPYNGVAPSEGDYRIADDFFSRFERAITGAGSSFEVVDTRAYFLNAFTISEVPNFVLNSKQKGYLIEWAAPKVVDTFIDELHLTNEEGVVAGFIEVKDDLSSSMNWISALLTDVTNDLRSAMTTSSYMAENMSEGYMDLTDSEVFSPYGDQCDLIKRAVALTLCSNFSFDGMTWVYETENMIKNMYAVSHFAAIAFQTESPSEVLCVNAPSFVHEGMSLYKHPSVNALIDKKWLRVANISSVLDNALQLTVAYSEQLQENQSFAIPSCDVRLHSPADYDYSVQISRFKLLCHDRAMVNAFGLYLVLGLNMSLINTTVNYMLRLINVSTNVSESAYTGLKIYKKIRNVALSYFGKTAHLLTVGLTSPINQSIVAYNVSDMNFSMGLQYNISHNAIMLLLRSFEEVGFTFTESLRTLIANTETRFETSILMEG